MNREPEKKPVGEAEVLELLWDKWKVGNTLAYQRWTAFWGANGIAVGGSAALLSTSFTPVTGVVCSILILFAGVLGLFWKRAMDIDVRVRNTHNPEIVKILQGAGYLKDIDVSGQHDPDSHDDPVNQWHALPRGEATRAKEFRGTGLVGSMMQWVSLSEIVGSLLALYFLLPRL